MNIHSIRPQFPLSNCLLSRSLLFSLGLLTAMVTFAGDDREEAAVARFAIAQSGITAKVAIANISQQYPGVIYAYELDDEDDRLVHEIKLINLEQKRKYKIKMDVKSGDIVSNNSKAVRSWFNTDEDLAAAKQLQASGFSIVAALGVLDNAEAKHGDNLLIEAELEANQGIHYFKIETFDDDGEKEWLVDITTKQLIPVFKH